LNVIAKRSNASTEGLSIFGAVTSSSAIAGWLIWKQLSALWAIVIALGQIYTVVKPSLPYAARLQSLIKLGPELDALAITAETKWYDVSHGLLTDQETYELTMSLKMQCQQAQDRAFDGPTLPLNDALFQTAKKKALEYMASIAGI
jgi:hypothetical protein